MTVKWSNPLPNEAGEESLPEYSESATVNVLVVGECQQGKSLLIRQLAKYGKIPGLLVGVGDGDIRCTTEVTTYDLPIKLRGYQLVDQKGTEIQSRPYAEMMELTDSEAKVVALPDPDTPSYTFRVIDTPGMNDTYGDDFLIMSQILSRVAEVGHINAVIYVRDVEQPFGASFKRFFQYLQRSMPSLCNGLIVVHSRFSVDRVAEHLQDEEERNQQQQQQRRRRLDELRRQAFEVSTGLNLQHFFMDNDPDTSSPFAVFESLSMTYRLLLHVASQKALRGGEIRLLKTDTMQNLDAHLMNALQKLSHGLEQRWAVEHSAAESSTATVMAARRSIAGLTAGIEQRRRRLERLRAQPDMLLGTRAVDDAYSFWDDMVSRSRLKLSPRELNFDSDKPISEVRKTCAGGCRWVEEEHTRWRWRGKLAAGWLRDISGTVTFYGSSDAVNKKELEALEKEITDMDEALVDQEEILARYGGADGNGNAKDNAEKLGRDAAKVEMLMSVVQQDELDVNLWPKLRPFYTSQTLPSRGDIRRAIGAYDTEVGKMLL